MTIEDVLGAGSAALQEGRVPSPRLTAEVMLAHCLARDRSFLYAHPERDVAPGVLASFRQMISRRAEREPLQYITGQQEFYGRVFHVNPDVLIPRPETELLVEVVLEINRWSVPRILDVGTGSGCIAATLALELPNARVLASDISIEALQSARENITKHRAEVRLVCMDLLDASRGPFEFIVSNPPYVGVEERDGLQVEVVGHEPWVALFGDGDPIGLYRELIRQAAIRLVSGGYLVLEIGYTMETCIRALFGTDWNLLPTRTDLQGLPRVISAEKIASITEARATS